ncbi:hypothetical protein OBBRIDRAFT_168403 [Obba rivulosa]|uniref:F-box domain-containing protein n=1 Tax=Obba rivulosa TaxID=1052685 RepID=A0A8E2AMC7_9APHY|nr:hypothetical protein OBBRIDRAFT_168403 [Obba rivulosa]
MHRCLQTLEILYLVLQCLGDEDDAIARATLAAVARTCRDFSEPALNILWERQDTIVNLIRCIPSDAWRMERQVKASTDRSKLLITRPLSPKDFARLIHYSRRIKHLTLTDKHYPTGAKTTIVVPKETFITLSIARLSTSLLPFLRTLHLECATIIWEFAHVFLARPLQKLTIRPPSVTMLPIIQERLASFLAYVAHLSPDMKTLKISLGCHGVQPMNLPEIILNVRGLQELFLEWPIPVEAASAMVQWLAALPHLSRLTIRHIYTPAEELQLLDVGVPWASLIHLILAPVAIDLASSLLPLFSSSHLSSLTVHSRDLPGVEAIEKFCQTLECQCSKPHLKRLILRHYHAEDGASISLKCLKPLLKFSNLQQLQIELPARVELDDSQLKELVRGWPCLQTLWIGNTVRTESYTPKLTFQCFVYLAMHCRSLEVLKLPLDATVTTVDMAEHPEGCLLDCLASFTITDSKIEDSIAVALILSELCPELTRIESHKSEFGEKWEMASKVLAALNKVRKQERERRGGEEAKERRDG